MDATNEWKIVLSRTGAHPEYVLSSGRRIHAQLRAGHRGRRIHVSNHTARHDGGGGVKCVVLLQQHAVGDL